MRNAHVRVTGGAYSRAGTKFVGYSAQMGRPYPPRLIPFQFSILQGRMLEFGNWYFRVILDGGYVTDITLDCASATNSSQLNMVIPNSGGFGVEPINDGVYASYFPGEVVTLKGGITSVDASVYVQNTTLLRVRPQLGSGKGYAPGDLVTLLPNPQGGATKRPIIKIATTQVNTITIVNPGAAGTDGIGTVQGTTGTGVKFQAQVTISGGKITQIMAVTTPGSYTVAPTNMAAEPVTGSVAGAVLGLGMGPATLTIVDGGTFISNPVMFTQSSTTGGGTGAWFIAPLFGIAGVVIDNPGSYISYPSNPVQQNYSTKNGQGAQFNMTWGSFGTTPAFKQGDWLVFSGVSGMTELNNQTLVVAGNIGDLYSFDDVHGNPVDSTKWGTYTGGGQASRIFTSWSPFKEEDLKWLKFTQSADVMSFCCVNQDTGTEYPPLDLSRISDTNWWWQNVDMKPTVDAPASCWLTESFNYALNSLGDFKDYPNPITASYAYCVTSINAADGTESVASPVGDILGGTAIMSVSGSITVNFANVPGVQNYNVYKAQPLVAWGYYPAPVPIGAMFGFIGMALGASFVDQNVVPDFSQTPPTHQNPFARGSINAVNALDPGGGSLYGVQVQINTNTGSGAVIVPVIQGSGYASNAPDGLDLPEYYIGGIVGYIVLDGGSGYLPTDTVTLTDGSGAQAALVVNPNSGTYPSVPGYYQQRRIYASSQNNPDTYWMSVTGAFKNFDTRIPTIESDAIQGSPWTQAVNGIQWLIPMPGGVITLTGAGAWLLSGDGSSPLNPQPIGPSSQQAQPQMSNGASPFIAPVKIEWDLVYVQSKGAVYRDFSLNNYFVNYYTGKDITVNSPHLFLNYQVESNAWCEEPYKLLWSVRNDGVMLSMTYYKAEQVLGWARHDTDGQFLCCASIIEPPVDALYVAVLRPIGPEGGVCCGVCIERMDNHLWKRAEGAWCVDSALQYAGAPVNASLAISSPDGDGAITGVVNIVGGQNYSTGSYGYVVDNNGLGAGAGAVVTLTIQDGVITDIEVTPGAGYSYPQLTIEDPSGLGSGAGATLVLETAAVFQTNVPVFSVSDIGNVIRAAGGVATITKYLGPTEVIANYTIPTSSFTVEINQGLCMPTINALDWTLTEPVQVVGGLHHLAGLTVTGLADGNVITPRVVDINGNVTLDALATIVTIGLGFTVQLQSMYLDAGEPTVQGQRKKIGAVTLRMDASRDFLVGANQVDGSTLSPMQVSPTWTNMVPVPNLSVPYYNGGPTPLWTGDIRVPVIGGVGKPGQVALMQELPLPMNCLAIIPEMMGGDTPEQKVEARRGKSKEPQQ